jgi:hypothetical protein
MTDPEQRPSSNDADPETAEAAEDTWRERALDAAIAAELETGKREETVEAAKRSLLVRLAFLIGGTLCVLLGIAMLVLPGPGLILIVVGLGLLAEDIPFAKRWMDRLKERLPQDESGKVSPWVFIISGTLLVASIAVSVWLMIR